ncbi:Glycosyltransferase involved in cell wall bisynthesis [Fodinibius roseus]|uniref:Glycosyltransferase involved in cell wall bisynthesis n=1 Tax=Fodinibius roseus TaxID=1194090 RepID=A0A1M5GRC6_9BACT|nr:glycosyltransferase [Fodinibius roseus]SHG06211.1 Glycosyltransferase involved in cell wall bisynthesis [Fodinibius roseus]
MAQTLLIIGSVWPEPDSSAAGRRMLQLITLFQSRGWEIVFASSASEGNYAADLQARDIRCVQTTINSSEFDEFIIKLQPSAVLFDRFIVEEQFGWRVAEQCPDTLRILDTEDLHCLRRTRRRAVQEGRPFEPRDLLEDDTAKREVASILRCDLSLIISDFEMTLLEDLFGVEASLLHYLPFLLAPVGEEDREAWPGFEERRHFVTIGNFRHPPNWDAVRYLKQQVWPLIRQQLPQAELHIHGAYPSQKARQLHRPEDGFYIEGRAADAKAVVRSGRVTLAPLRFGAGLKGKLVESMRCGTPSVTTRIGAEGLSGRLPWSGAVVDEPQKIASAAVQLYTDREAWYQAQGRGIRIINERFDKEQFAGEFTDRLSAIRQDLRSHRRNNFMGGILMHHTTASTRYMAKWIEEKNRHRREME